MYWSLILLVAAIIVGIAIYLYFKKRTKKTSTFQLTVENVDKLAEYGTGRSINLTIKKGYSKYKLIGINYLNLPFHIIGEFSGYAEAETDGGEIYASIAIYDEEGLQRGFIPKKNYELYSYIVSKGGTVDAYGYLASKEINTDFYGEVCIEFK